MAADLREAMHNLAELSPTLDRTASAGPQTWRSARRSKRRGLALVSLIVAAVLAAGAVVGLAVSRPQVEPASPRIASALAMPDQIWRPSPWVPGTASAGPIGPLALIGTAPRHTSWFGTDDSAIFGISAATGVYRFIDLPHLADESGVNGVNPALSPDGRYIGYFVAGTPSGSYRQSSVVGFAVYNTVTGAVTQHFVPTVHGLLPVGLTWSGDSRALVAEFNQWTGGPRSDQSSTDIALSLIVRTTRVIALHGFDTDPPGKSGPAPKGVLAFTGRHGKTLRSFDPFTGTSRATPVVDASFSGQSIASPPIANPSGTRVAFGGRPSEGFGPRVFEADMAPGTRFPARVHPVTGSTAPVERLIGWADDDDLVALTPLPWFLHTTPRPAGLYRVDVRTGQRTLLSRLHGANWGDLQGAVATDFFERPTVAASPPASPRDPRVVPLIVGGSLIGLLLLAGLVWAYSWNGPSEARRALRARA